MNKLKSVLFVFLCSIMLHTKSQVIIYSTYEDYTQNKGVKYDDYNGWSHAGGSVTLYLENNKKKVSVKCKDIWGLTYDSALYRIDKRLSQPYVLAMKGKIFLYLNGCSQLSFSKHETYSPDMSPGYAFAISRDINSAINPLTGYNRTSAYKEFKENNPDLIPLFDCLGKNPTDTKVLSCVESFNK